jgi:hypothetical protein
VGEVLAIGGGAPVDLLVDTLAQNQSAVDDKTWNAVTDIALGIRAREEKRTGTRVPRDLPNYQGLPVRIEDMLAAKALRGGYRIIANKLEIRQGLAGSLVVCRGLIRTESILGCVVFSNERINVGDGQPGCLIKDSIVFCDGDIKCEAIVESIVIATGSVSADRWHKSSVHQKLGTDQEVVKLFSLSAFGIRALPDETGVRIGTLEKDSPFKRAGLLQEDVILSVNHDSCRSISHFHRVVRAALARRAMLTIEAQRGPIRVVSNVRLSN